MLFNRPFNSFINLREVIIKIEQEIDFPGTAFIKNSVDFKKGKTFSKTVLTSIEGY